MEEFLKKLGINKPTKLSGNTITVSVDTYDEFSAIYNVLEQSEEIRKDSDESSFNMDDAHIVYFSEEYELHLNGDLKDDVYVLTITKIEEEN